jgi:hypothetical protein
MEDNRNYCETLVGGTEGDNRDNIKVIFKKTACTVVDWNPVEKIDI